MTPADETRRRIDNIADLYGYTADDVFGPSRKREIVLARSACIYYVYRTKKQWSLEAIGNYFGVCHTTVMRSIGRAAEFRGDDHPYVRQYRKCLVKKRRAKSDAKVANVVDSRISDGLAS